LKKDVFEFALEKQCGIEQGPVKMALPEGAIEECCIYRSGVRIFEALELAVPKNMVFAEVGKRLRRWVFKPFNEHGFRPEHGIAPIIK